MGKLLQFPDKFDNSRELYRLIDKNHEIHLDMMKILKGEPSEKDDSFIKMHHRVRRKTQIFKSILDSITTNVNGKYAKEVKDDR